MHMFLYSLTLKSRKSLFSIHLSWQPLENMFSNVSESAEAKENMGTDSNTCSKMGEWGEAPQR